MQTPASPARLLSQWSVILALCVVIPTATATCLAADSAQPPKSAGKSPRPAARGEPSFAPVTDDPNLPRVLLIGDSISMGYTVPVRELLAGKANVHRSSANCESTAAGLKRLDAWLGEGKWDVIHFNFGLHDLKYVDARGRYVEPSKGKQLVPIEQYEKNLRQIVARLKQTGAKLIWAATTPVPEQSLARVAGEELAYNEVAAKVMRESGVPIDDLHAAVAKDIAKLQGPHNVHFLPEGYQQLARAVAASIEAALKKK